MKPTRTGDRRSFDRTLPAVVKATPSATLRYALLYQARLGRRWLRRFAQMARYRRTSLADVPLLFANSFPKSGTHLLTQILQGFTRIGPAVESGLPAIVTFEGDSGRARPVAEILRDLQRLKPADVAYGHLHALPEVVTALCRPGVAPYFILRDPRDVVVSHVHYVTEMEPGHIHHDYYKNTLPDFEARMKASILGRPDPEIPFPDIRSRFEPYLGWQKRQEVLMLRFEDFILHRQQAVGQVLDHALARGFPLSVDRLEAIDRLAACIDPQRSPTFRSGKVGGWKDSFSPANKDLFKQVCGDLLVQLGYETNNDW